jgi:spermidine synthase
MDNEKIVLSRVTTPQGELQLQKWIAADGVNQSIYEIIFNGVFLMASYNERSSRAAAMLAIEPLIKERKDIRVLIGGLGIGYTLREALDFNNVSEIDVVEISEHIIHWAKSFFTELNGNALSDSRVRLLNMDVKDHIMTTGSKYDTIILDVDNGPTMLALEDNRGLYEKQFLSRIKDILTEGGILTVWAEKECQPFHTRLEEIFGYAEVISVQEKDRRDNPTDYYIYRTRLVT